MVPIDPEKITHNITNGVVSRFPSGAIVRPDKIEGGTQLVFPPEDQVGTELGKTEIGIVKTEGFSIMFIRIDIQGLIVTQIQSVQPFVDVPGLGLIYPSEFIILTN